jgi:hypothetical protein
LQLDKPAQQILSTPIPAQAHDPARMAGQVRHLLSRRSVIDSDDRCVARSSEILVRWAESHSAYRSYEPAERVRQFTCGVVEDVDAAVLVARGGYFTVG